MENIMTKTSGTLTWVTIMTTIVIVTTSIVMAGIGSSVHHHLLIREVCLMVEINGNIFMIEIALSQIEMTVGVRYTIVDTRPTGMTPLLLTTVAGITTITNATHPLNCNRTGTPLGVRREIPNALLKFSNGYYRYRNKFGRFSTKTWTTSR